MVTVRVDFVYRSTHGNWRDSCRWRCRRQTPHQLSSILPRRQLEHRRCWQLSTAFGGGLLAKGSTYHSRGGRYAGSSYWQTNQWHVHAPRSTDFDAGENRSSWGHVWVIVAVVLRVPKWNKSFALPVLCRLYRAEKLCESSAHTFYKKPELARQLIKILASALPTHRIYVVGDQGYTNREILQNLPKNVHHLGRARMDAALYAVPKKHLGRGRPRVKGERLWSPQQHSDESKGWQSLEVHAYGRVLTVEYKVFDALWYRVARGRLVRFVLVRGWPGYDHDDILCSTDTSLSAKDIIEIYCLRWSIEVTFRDVKQKLGFEDPQNRTDHAVERTAPMALWTFSLTVVWYLSLDKRVKSAQIPQYPWYEKTAPAFSDMLAALRREIWRESVLDLLPLSRQNQKNIEPLLYEVAYAA